MVFYQLDSEVGCNGQTELFYSQRTCSIFVHGMTWVSTPELYLHFKINRV